ncbi:uncharacterized protein K489DRAFT_102912 [Dissoconium aciculare CBS 342.82]|uniref:Uncharacterized protein n=1 Tax=Dissoconium aciculare CBS 342.82 TaxID=1314786 RepID=A0A6J3MDL2_9PEZI|nr:uncharacterized protein K489DRAFT_102912 [Dissoconium aciculare CBS 342.82]KAF1825968.1 hypothetical protein K489DRAFT_102912 [Dissoconium aciculare CBS 342.82]
MVIETNAEACYFVLGIVDICTRQTLLKQLRHVASSALRCLLGYTMQILMDFSAGILEATIDVQPPLEVRVRRVDDLTTSSSSGIFPSDHRLTRSAKTPLGRCSIKFHGDIEIHDLLCFALGLLATRRVMSEPAADDLRVKDRPKAFAAALEGHDWQRHHAESRVQHMCLASQTKSCSDRRSLICSSQGSMLVTSRDS